MFLKGKNSANTSKLFITSYVILTMRFTILLVSITCFFQLGHAETRTWKSKDGGKFLVAEYVSHTRGTVTVKRPDGKLFTLNRSDLQEEDTKFLATLPSPTEPATTSTPNKTNVTAPQGVEDAAVFDNIKLGDTHKEVTDKIKASKLLELTVDEIYLGRVGLNGSYRTKSTIGGLKCLLYFDWDTAGLLKEVTLQTQAQPLSEYQGLLQSTWKELIKLMTSLHGAPLQNANFPAASILQNDMSMSSHLWQLNPKGSALLGTSKSAEGYMVSVRFTTDKIEPIRVEK